MAGKMEKRRPKADKSLVKAMPMLAGFYAKQREHPPKQEMPKR